jgi:hypothetical protein
VKFQVLAAASKKMTAFWDVALCSLVEGDRPFSGAYCLRKGSLTIEALRTSETWVYFNETTRRYIPESLHLQKYTFIVFVLGYSFLEWYVGLGFLKSWILNN